MYRCLNELTSLDFNLTSNVFYKNNSMNGGAIYFSNIDKENIIDINESISIENNNFESNHADYYGGAMDLEFHKLNVEKYNNNYITNNVAGVLGGGVYISNFKSNDNILFNMYKNSSFTNNKVGSYVNDYSSRPSFISLNSTIDNNIIQIKTGERISLNFIFQDIFNKTVMDISNYYSAITMKLLLSNKYPSRSNNDDDNIDNNYKMLKNYCNFYNGKKYYKTFLLYLIFLIKINAHLRY